MYWIDLKVWNKQFHNPKITKLVRLRIARMTTQFKQTVMLNTEASDVPQHVVDAILEGYPESMVKAQGPLSPTAYLRTT